MFVNRDRELKFLEHRYASNTAEMVILYGRRRVGKTELLRTFCQGKPHLFFVADLGTEESLLAEFTRQISEFAYGDPTIISPFTTWEVAFNFLIKQESQRRLIVVLDEFTYLIHANAALPSLLQKLWDTRLQPTNLMLILCGSYIGMMEQEVLAYRSPLYGRRTGQWRLHPFTFWDAHKLLPKLPAQDMVRAYAILGGVPAYLRRFADDVTLLTNIEQNILTAGEYLYDEPRFLLLQELRDPSRYFAILEAIAGGHTRLNEIAQTSGVNVSSLPFYIKTLQELGLVTRAVPATEKNPDKSKMGLYQLTDQYFRFWFRFVYPNRSLLERGETSQVLRLVDAQLEQFTGAIFEMICREAIWRLQSTDQLPFTPQRVGNWWDRNEEIDLVAVGTDALLLGECKWSNKPLGTNILEDLKAKSRKLNQKQEWQQLHYALFARSGFTPALEEQAQRENVLLVDLNRLINL